MQSLRYGSSAKGAARGGFSPAPHLWHPRATCAKKKKEKKIQVLVEHDGSFPSFC